jgi:N-acetylglucosaminyl-diphospho-decaprenol L-rhamnosyltransferase
MNETPNQDSCAIIIVTHNSERYLEKNLRCLDEQTYPPQQIVIVDSGSENLAYLSDAQRFPNVQVVIAGKDVGFCQGNNIGIKQVRSSCNYVLFLNPDAFLTPTFLERAIETLKKPQYAQTGLLTGVLLGYDIDADCANERYDSTGIFRSWYGRFYDRDQGQACLSIVRQTPEYVPAICGALMFCRTQALQEVQFSNGEIFDGSFFMYKEDIDLSFRLRDKGWLLLLEPNLIAYHCRGWNRNRRQIPKIYRLLSARNELQINIKRRSLYSIYSFLKYLAVRFADA